MLDSVKDHTTQILFQRIRGGDDGAKSQLVSRIDPLIRKFARGRIPNSLRHESDTNDLIQSSWADVLKRMNSLEVQDSGDFFAYLRTVLVHNLYDMMRRAGRNPTQLASHDKLDGDEVLVAESVDPTDWISYEQALNLISKEHRNVVVMRVEFGMSFEEMANELGETPNGVRMKFNRAMARMARAASNAS